LPQFIRNSGKGAQNQGPDAPDGFHYYAMKTVKKVAVCKSKADTEHIRTEQRVLSRVKVKKHDRLAGPQDINPDDYYPLAPFHRGLSLDLTDAEAIAFHIRIHSGKASREIWKIL